MTPGRKQVYVAILINGKEIINESSRSIDVNASGVAAGEVPAPTAQPTSEETIGTENEARQEKTRDFIDGLKKNTYLGLVFLLPALAFSLVVSSFKDDKQGQKILSAESLKEVFYAQCYYFTPISLFTYIMLYGFMFGTMRVLGTISLAFLAFLGMWIWFYGAEVTAVLQERKSKNKLVAHLIVLSTFIVLAVVSWNIWGLASQPETLRLRAYKLLEYGIYFVFFYTLIFRRIINWWKSRRNKKAGVSASLVERLPKSGIKN
jgi:hypothetical protein